MEARPSMPCQKAEDIGVMLVVPSGLMEEIMTTELLCKILQICNTYAVLDHLIYVEKGPLRLN